ncbi:hypothetical protein K1719_029535 [Acacia pycnantha]|nr:hypothetical protein K1719_029535 [Acacia pycnantha]
MPSKLRYGTKPKCIGRDQEIRAYQDPRVQQLPKLPCYCVILYVPGMSDVTAVEIYDNERHEWKPMRRVGRKGWVQSSKSAIPGDWKVGASYDCQVHV